MLKFTMLNSSGEASVIFLTTAEQNPIRGKLEIRIADLTRE